MTQANEIFETSCITAIEIMRARNQEIVVRCDKHGEFTRADLIQRGGRDGECPICNEEKRHAFLKKQRAQNAMDYFRSSSGVPARFQEAGFSGYRPETDRAEKILSTLTKYVERFDQHKQIGLSLILCGRTGTGKTHLACAVLRYLAENQGITGKYSTAYRAVQEIRASYKSNEKTELQALEAFIAPDILVLDEIGVQYGTDSESILLFSILNGRYEALKPSIIVSNLTVEELKNYLSDRVYDRLRENGGGVLTFDWESYRIRGGRK